MNSREIKTAISNIENASNDETIMDILNLLKRDVKPTEMLLRETKVGVSVNKLRASKNPKISTLVKSIIKKWREIVNNNSTSNVSSNNKALANSGSKILNSIPSVSNSNLPRNARTDNVNVQIYDDKTRVSSLSALYNALVSDRPPLIYKPSEAFKIIKEIEALCHKQTLYQINDTYRSKLRTLVMNIRSKNNPQLRYKILNGDISPSSLVKMSPEEMINDTLKEKVKKMKEENLFNAEVPQEKRAVTDRFTCGKCKQKRVSYFQMQTRSADEPLTTFCRCENCDNRWKFS
ncbi:transcription elongation factor DST1 [Ascoidea rubescens DSM 1968]|uniref:Transcription elongation factor n=1 Tax=Ascoidea rubescens DSM 1968 TaxID=1344418 RepID=A0A1D2VJB2_9ASCO|nr:general transcription elongation factor [Ascoidea rubescens DSM 1968]ODV61653.1 general transcription elongation factor [Ascoidea rubescens DSM 1968]